MNCSSLPPPAGASAPRRARPGVAALLALVTCAAAAGPAGAALLRPTAPTPEPLASVVVRAVPGQSDGARAAVLAVGGRVTGTLSVIDGIVAKVPVSALPALGRDGDVAAVSPNGRLALPALSAPVVTPTDAATSTATTVYDGVTDAGAVPNLARTIGADSAWQRGITGKGVTVAVIDTGVSPVKGLDTGNLADGPDLSFDGQDPALAHQDAYGHGTHMSGIIAGRDHAETDPTRYALLSGFTGVAPDARVLDVKVGAADGAVDVSQIIAAIGWVVDNKEREGIGVLNLSFGTVSTQDYRTDPVALAVQKAWDAGIVVVAAAGNDGNEINTLTNPASHPGIIAVGGSDSAGTVDRRDDGLASFANRGTGVRHADLVAPAVGITSLRVPGSTLDSTHPEARRGERFFRGSGTSQSTAVVSGTAALVRQMHPEYTPDQVKAALVRSAWGDLPGSVLLKGSGQVDAAAAIALPKVSVEDAAQQYEKAQGGGSLEAARGDLHVTDSGKTLQGERDITGAPWSGTSWRGSSWSGTSWRGSSWSGRSWSGSSWSGSSWSGRSWSGSSWSGSSWSGSSWSGSSWSGTSWSGTSWR